MTFSSIKNRGFTIIESLVAVAILATAIIGTMSAVQSGLSSYIFSKEQIAAFYIAQEGFEKVRNMRDENTLNGRTWLYGLASVSGDPCYFGNSCTVSPLEVSGATRCSSPGNCPVLRQDPATQMFGYNSAWTATPYTREISIASVSADEVAVTVTVRWSKGALSRTFKARENLLNWQ